MDWGGWVLAFIFLFVFVILSFRTWIYWLRHRDEFEEPLSDWIPPAEKKR